jgi:1,4-dihydroxy-2-naphthoate polyprenyltransferase
MAEKDSIRTNSFRAWVLASRPKTLAGAMVPVAIGIALAVKDSGFRIDCVPALLCLLFALLMQVDANFVNDYFDWRHGNDDEASRLGPLRACSMGWITPRAMLIALFVTTGVACAVGIPLIFYGGFEMIIIGVLCVVFCVLYTTVFSYIGLGDLLVLLFFGVVPVCITYYIQIGCVPLVVLNVSLACGLAVDNLLILNNYRDIDNDRRSGKRTLIVVIGRKWGLRLYLLLGIMAALMMSFYRGFNVKAVLMLVYLVFHLQAYSQMRLLTGRDLNRVLGMTSRNILVFGVVSTLVILL